MRDIAFATHELLKSDLTNVTGSETKQFAARYMIDSIIRKLEPINSDQIDNLTLEKFREVNDQCSKWVMPTDDIASMHFLEMTKGFLDLSIDQVEPFVCLESLVWDLDLGPGSNRGGHPSCNFALKLAKGLTGNPSLLRLFDTAVELYNLHIPVGPARTPLESSSLSFVPKTMKTSRMICTEPTVNMLFQKALSEVFERVLRRWHINMSTQPDRNRELARIGSLTGEFCTIDLSSASDSISLELARWLIPARIMKWIEVTRSKSTTYKGETIPLNMVSTMGNGYTSSFQTLLFFAIARTCCDDGEVSVFGDDIIVPAKYAHRVLKTLRAAGFCPNMSKTFVDGPFRESCGEDYYLGKDVRPHFIKSLDTDSDLCTMINRVRLWSETQGIPIPLVEDYFEQIIEERKLPMVPTHESESAGVYSRRAGFPYVRREIKFWADGPDCLGRRGDKSNYSMIDAVLYERLAPVKQSYTFGRRGGSWEKDILSLAARDYTLGKSNLLETLFLRGGIRNGSITFRSTTKRLRLEQTFMPIY